MTKDFKRIFDQCSYERLNQKLLPTTLFNPSTTQYLTTKSLIKAFIQRLVTTTTIPHGDIDTST